jgi:hypothetical protein
MEQHGDATLPHRTHSLTERTHSLIYGAASIYTEHTHTHTHTILHRSKVETQEAKHVLTLGSERFIVYLFPA